MAKANASKTVVGLVLDETGSMYNIADDTRGAVNQYFEELAKETPNALVSLYEFSAVSGEDVVRPLCSGVEVDVVPSLTEFNYRPRGNTPLYDAIGYAITNLETVEADKFILVIMTDGLENSSTEWTAKSIKDKIEKMQDQDNWTIVYLGANQDAWAVGASMGVSAGSTMSYASTGTGITKTMAKMSHATAHTVSSPKMSTDTFFEDAGQSKEDYEDDEN